MFNNNKMEKIFIDTKYVPHNIICNINIMDNSILYFYKDEFFNLKNSYNYIENIDIFNDELLLKVKIYNVSY